MADVLDERGALKKAGFVEHEPNTCNLSGVVCKACRASIGKRWWSDKVEAATRLKEFCNPKALSVMREHLARLEKSKAVDADIVIPAPPGLQYLGYQKAGIAYALQRKDTLIGDDMGLGKTCQSLGFINYTKPHSVLVVCPATLVYNWKDEALRWLVDDYCVWPVKDKKDKVPDNEKVVVIVNYDKLGGKTPLSESLKRQWDVVVFDECQVLKNPDSARSQNCIGQNGLMSRAKRTLFLSGTPMENYPKEIWPIAAAICPAKFGNWVDFAKRYCGFHYENHGDRRVAVTTGGTNLAELQQRLRSSFMVRRLKKDVLPELPLKRRQMIFLKDAEKDWANHPQFKRWREFYERDFDAALAKMESATTEEEYQAAALALEKFTGVAFTEMSEFRHATALAKLPLCIKYIDEMLASGVPNLVVFAHHTDVLDKLKKHFADDCVVVSGCTPDKGPNSREMAVKQFQEGKKKIFLGQIRAAGVGLTLTAANTVVFVEIDWVPGVLSQAEDRLCRIGQTKMVHVIHLVLEGTLDANMVKKIVTKQIMIDKALDKMNPISLKKRKRP